MNQLSGDSIAKGFFSKKKLLSRAAAGAKRTQACQPGLKGSGAVSRCPVVLSAPCCPSPTAPSLWEALALCGYY